MTIFHGKQAEIVDCLIRLEELVRVDYWSIPVMLEMWEVSHRANQLLYEEYDGRNDPGGRMVMEAHDDFAFLFFELLSVPVARNDSGVKLSRQQILTILRKLVSAIFYGDRVVDYLGGKPLHLKEDAQ